MAAPPLLALAMREYLFNKKYFLAVVAMFVLVVSVWSLETNPGFWFDEGIIAGAADNIAKHGVYGTQVAPEEFHTNNFWITTGYPAVFPMALVFKLFGSSVVTARIIPLLYLFSFVIVAYFFLRKLYGETPAMFSTALLATFAPLYGNGKAVLGETPGLFWIVLGSSFYLLFEERREKKFLLAAAFSWGLAAATKPYYLLFSISALFVALYARLHQKTLQTVDAVMSGVIFLLPVALWAFFAFDTSSFANFNSTLSYFLNSYGVATFEPLANLFRFVSESTPIHFAVLAITVFAAWIFSKKHGIQTPAVVGGLLIFIALSFLWYLKTPGWYRYFYAIHVLVILLFPAAVLFLAERWNKRHFGAGILSALILFQTIFLFTHYNQFAGDGVLRLKAYAEESLPKDASIFVASKPEVFFALPQENKAQYVFINENMIIGEEMLQGKAYEYLITGKENERFFVHNQEIIDTRYLFVEKVGGYRIYALKDILVR